MSRSSITFSSIVSKAAVLSVGTVLAMTTLSACQQAPQGPAYEDAVEEQAAEEEAQAAEPAEPVEEPVEGEPVETQPGGAEAEEANAGGLEVDDSLPEYEKVSGVSGNLNSVGSDTLNNLMALWAEAFQKQYPNVNIQIEGKGSSTAPPALISGTAQLGPMSRQMKSTEEDQFEAKYGFKPTAVGVALDSLAVYVNKDNRIESLSFPELDAVFSKTRNSGYPQSIETWGQLGLGGSWEGLPISLYGRNSASGTYAYFKEHALFEGDFKDTVKEQPGSASVVMGIAEDKAGIGYSGIGYMTSGVRVVPLAEEQGEEAYGPTYDNVLSGKYPLGRMLYVYVVKKPGEPLPTLAEEFLKLVLSKEGQQIVLKDGYLPLPAPIVEKQLTAIE